MLPKAMPAEPGRTKPALRDRPAGTSSERIERLAQSMRTSADRDLWDEQRRGSRLEQEALRAQQRQKSEGHSPLVSQVIVGLQLVESSVKVATQI